ncbi:MAG: carboxypeptidase regulatory-like domain-containing protein [Acidobacteria bacterium]|nr:carboxypeptidase regulatory-like domain-containing protein [Acidobacteriota bacterium]
MKRILTLLTLLVCAFSGFSQTNKTRRPNATQTMQNAAPVTNTNTLPIRRVILYSNGVAYIERRGIVTGNAEVNLSFKQSQVDDVLKSMVVLDLGKGKIGAVSYNSSAPVAARMAEIPFSVDPVTPEGGGLAGVLSQMQGAKVSVATAQGNNVGSILTVERKTIRGEKETFVTNVLVIASDNGEISSFDLKDVRGLKLLDEGARNDLNEFASATASARRLDAKTITVTSEGAGQREMIVSYTIAAPIWKTTYRVVLDEAGKPFFQGWAIVDNISEEDWNAVSMSLVSGSPVSFIQNLQKPFYRYRPVIPMPQDLQLRPQVYEPQSGTGSGSGIGGSAIAGVVTDANGAVVSGASVTLRNESNGQTFSTSTESDGSFARDNLPSGSYSVVVNSPGFRTLNVQNTPLGRTLKLQIEVGSLSSTVNVTASQVETLPRGSGFTSLLKVAPGFAVNGASGAENELVIDGQEVANFRAGQLSNTRVSDALTSGNSGITAAATGDEIGDLFEYRIAQPVTVLRNRSALIPIVQTQMEGERVAVYNESVRTDRPFSGVLLKNTTDLTLEAGSMTVLDGNAYAGEALMDRLKAKEQRLISFALDLGTRVTVRPKDTREPAKLIKASRGIFEVHFFRTEEKVYQISNQTEHAKTVYIEFPIRHGWELSGDTQKPDYSTQSFYRFRVELKGFEDKEVKIGLRQPLMESYQIGSVTRQQLDLFLTRRYIDEATKERLSKLIELREKIGSLEARLESFDDEVDKIEADQKRLRENIESLSKTAEAKALIARYITKAGEQETRLEEMEKERKTITSEKEKLEAEPALAIRTFEIN